MNDQIKILGPDGLKRIYANIQAGMSIFQNNTLNDIKDFKSSMQNDISSAMQNVISATSNAQSATDDAISAADKANAAASNADEKALLAQTAADNANNFIESANSTYATKTELGDYSKTTDIESTYVSQSNYNSKMDKLDKADSDNLAAAKLYSDQGNAITLQNAKKDAASNYVSKADYNEKMSALDGADSDNLAKAKNYADIVSGNALNDAKVYVNDAVGKITSFEMSIVESLPSTGKKGTIYLIGASDGSGDDVYNEYIWIPSTSKFEKIGTTRIDLTPYAKSADVANGYLAKTENAMSATKLATARNIALTGAVTGNANFDGSGNISIDTSVNHGHSSIEYIGNHSEAASGTSANSPNTGMAVGHGLSLTGTYNDASTPVSYGNIINVAGAGTGQLLCEWSGSDSVTGGLYYRSHRDTSSGGWGPWKAVAYTDSNISGNAATASKLATARNIALTGAVTGNANFDGSGNISIDTSVNHSHNYAGSSSAGGDANRAMAIADYGDVSRTINIGFSGPGISGDQIGYIAGYTDNGTKIKDVSKDALRGWIGLGSAAYTNSSVYPISFTFGSDGKDCWVHMCDVVMGGDSLDFLMWVYTGAGFNGGAYQNSMFKIMVKNGWQPTPSAETSFGATVYRFDCSNVKVKVIASSSSAFSVYIYFPWAYANGVATVYGVYDSVNMVRTVLDSEPTGVEQSIIHKDIVYTDSIASSSNCGTTAPSSLPSGQVYFVYEN